jgi:hypothetical protein
VGAQAGDGVMDVVDSEHDAMQAQRVGRRVLRAGAVRRGGVVLGQLQLAVAVRGPHHRDLAPDAVESDGAVGPKAFDVPLAYQLHAELGEERDSGVQVVDNDGDVVHPLNCHGSEPTGATDTGRQILDVVLPVRRAFSRALFSGLSSHEQEQLIEVLTRIRSRVRELRDAPAEVGEGRNKAHPS